MVPRKAPIIQSGVLYWRCSKCGELKEPTDFGKDKYAVNELQSSCKLCSTELTKRWQRANPEKARTTQKAYLQSERGKKIRREWNRKNAKKIVGYVMANRQTESGQKIYRKATDKYKANNPQKVRARELAYNARESGKLVRLPCEVCSTTENIHAHHDDYSKPLEVRWLCRTHHNEYHQKEKANGQKSTLELLDIVIY